MAVRKGLPLAVVKEQGAMADTGMKDQRRDAAGAQRGGRRAEGSHLRREDRDGGTARGWLPSAPRDDPARGKESLATMFDRLAEAAAAHDGEAAGGIFEEIERAFARPVKRLASG
jgi:hypothetical protein